MHTTLELDVLTWFIRHVPLPENLCTASRTGVNPVILGVPAASGCHCGLSEITVDAPQPGKSRKYFNRENLIRKLTLNFASIVVFDLQERRGRARPDLQKHLPAKMWHLLLFF